ncbi:papilin [Drosophila gunungcola]|uniref:papilin n=1 Tax=Drosophila gunungcola TaxID=103775 RepID=UPI0022E6D35C|nr:papilin [Drosophila gunungcola]
MSPSFATLMLLFMVAAYAADLSSNQLAGIEDFPDFEDNLDSDDVTVTEASNGTKVLTEATIITGTTISSIVTTNDTKTGPTASPIFVNAGEKDTNVSFSAGSVNATTSDSAEDSSTVLTTKDSRTIDSVSTISPTTTQSSTINGFTTTVSTSNPATTISTTRVSTATDSTITVSTTLSTTDESSPSDSTTDSSTTVPSAPPALTTDSTTDKSTASFSTTDSTTEYSTTDSTTDNSSTSDSTTDSIKDSTIDKSTTSVFFTDSTPVITTTTEQQTEDEIVLSLLAEGFAGLIESDSLINAISTLNWNISAGLDNQSEYFGLIENTEELLQNTTKALLSWEAKLLQEVVNSIQRIDLLANRTSDTITHLLRFQKFYHDRIKHLGGKLKATQSEILRRSKRLDNKINFIDQILRTYIEPKVNGLTQSLANLNTSQVNSQIELENLSIVENLTKASIIKMSSLNNQIAIFNQAQESRFYALDIDVKSWAPTKLNTIDDLFQTLSISQKRTDLALAICGSLIYYPNSYSSRLENNKIHYVNYESEKH